MSSNECDLVVIGGGIVGLSTAMQLATRLPGLRIIVLEKEEAIGSHQTSHNSGVIHSGIYYKPGSLKARLCVEGAVAMVDFCKTHGIPVEICGKLIVATSSEQLPQLLELQKRAQANGVPGVALLGPEQARELEPHAKVESALHVPGTGITDYSAVARKYGEMLTGAGGTVRTRAGVKKIRIFPHSFVIETPAGEFTARFLINCAGLHSDRIAVMCGASLGLRIIPFRGEYYQLTPECRGLVRGLIYPVPDPRFPFLGVHFTRRINGEVEAGPNAVLALEREGYRKTDIDLRDMLEIATFMGFWRMAGKYWKTGTSEVYRSFSKKSFVRDLRQLVPELQEGQIARAGSGVRAQAVGQDGSLIDDFRFVQQGRALHVCNVPSPAATASLPIGRSIVEMAARQFEL